MTLPSFSLILVGVLLNAAAQLLLKAGTNAMPARPAARDRAAHPGGPRLLRGERGRLDRRALRVPVSIAYPMLSIGYVVNAIAAWYLLGEAVTPMRLVESVSSSSAVFIVARS